MRGEGELVFNDDIVVFHSKSTGLHIGFNHKKSIKQLDTRRDQQGWKISAFSMGVTKGTKDKLAINAGNYLRLFHREQEGFLSTRYNDTFLRIDSNKDNLLVDNLFDKFLKETNLEQRFYLNLHLSDIIKKSKETHSSTNIFKIELERQNDGSLIKTSKAIRLKNVINHGYLGVKKIHEESDQLSLTYIKDYDDANTLFNLIPMATDNMVNYARFGQQFRIRHKQTGLFVGVSQMSAKFMKKLGARSGGEEGEGEGEDEENEDEEDDGSGHDQDGQSSQKKTNSVTGSVTMTQKTGEAEKNQVEVVREQRYKQIRKKERDLLVSEYPFDEDFFRLQAVSNDDMSDLTIISAYAQVLQMFVNTVGNFNIIDPPIKAAEVLSQTLVALIIEVTALTRSNFTIDYKEIFAYTEYSKPKRTKQKIMIEQYVVELLHKVLLFFWRNYFVFVYGKGENPLMRQRTKKAKKEKDKQFIEYERVCKLAHLLLILIVRNNPSALKKITQIDLMELLLEQISTPWQICLKDLFEIVSEKSADLNVLQKSGIKQLVDQLHQEIRKRKRYLPKIVELLTYVCAPGKKTDRRIQEMVLEMIVGRPELSERYKTNAPEGMVYDWDIQRGCFLFYVDQDKDANGNIFYRIYTNTDHWERPPFIQLVEQRNRQQVTEIQLFKKSNKQQDPEQYEETWLNVEDFLVGDDSLVRNEKYFENKKQYKSKVKYFRELIKLYTAMSEDYNKENQKLVSQLMPPEFLLYMINSSQISLWDKRKFMDLLVHLYINHYSMEIPGNSLMPEILVWNEYKVEETIDNQINEEKGKLFTLKTFEKKKKYLRLKAEQKAAAEEEEKLGEMDGPGRSNLKPGDIVPATAPGSSTPHQIDAA